MKHFSIYPVEKVIMEIILELCDIAGYGMKSGINIGAKGNEAAKYILNKLHAAGLIDAKFEPIKVNSPFPDEYEVKVEAEGKETILSDFCFPLHWTLGTPPEGVMGELVYIGYGLESDFERVNVAGKIVLIDEKFMRGYIPTAKEATIKAIEKGASAVFRANLIVDSPQQQKGEGTPSKPIPAPVFCFGQQSGNYLRKLALSNTPHTVKIKLIVPHKVYDANNIVFELPGNGSTDEVILVGTHYDTGHFTGAVDNRGIAPSTSPWVNVASIPLYYHSIFDTPDKITLEQIKRAYVAHIEILENIDQLPEGFLFYDNINKNQTNKRTPQVRIAILSDTVFVGDTVKVWNDETCFYADKMSYHYPALLEWAGTTWDWGDGTPIIVDGPTATHVYKNPGKYTITMKFTDTKGTIAIDTKEIKVLPLPST